MNVNEIVNLLPAKLGFMLKKEQLDVLWWALSMLAMYL